jgi:hypothetical protein
MIKMRFRRALGYLGFLLSAFACYAQSDNYQIVVESNTVATNGQIRWRCEKNATVVYTARTNLFAVGTPNADLRAFLKAQLGQCISDNSGTITNQLESDSLPPIHGAAQHDGTVEATTRKDVASGYPGLSAAGKISATEVPTLNQSTTGNASTASALAADPVDCAANQTAGGVNASGTATGCIKQLQFAVLAGDYTNATTTASAVGALNFAVAASTNYIGVCNLTHQVSATTSGIKLSFTGPASPTAIVMVIQTSTSATTVRNDAVTAFSTLSIGAATTLAATKLPVQLFFRLSNGTTAGTLQLNAASFGTGTLTIAQNVSYCWMREQ